MLASETDDGEGAYFESYYGYFTYGWHPLAGWVDSRGKYVHAEKPQFFDPLADPGETADLAQAHEAELERYRSRIARLFERTPLAPAETDAGGPDEALLRDIRGLGYAGFGASGEELPHPLQASDRFDAHTRTGIHGRQAEAQEFAMRGQLGRAAQVYEQILEENPHNYLALDELAGIRHREGALDEAIEHLQRLVAEAPPRGRLFYRLGLCLLEAERTEEAIAPLERAAALTRGRARYLATLRQALEQLGRSAEAEALEERYR